MPYYAVAHGRQTGVVKSWKECQLRVQGYRGAIYETFRHATDAYNFVDENNPSKRSEHCTKIFIDGAFQGDQCGYGVWYGDDDPRNAAVPLFQAKEELPLNNQRAELRAMIHVFRNIQQEIELNNGIPLKEYVILTDSQATIKALTIWSVKWKKNGWKTTKGEIIANKDLISEAVELLESLEQYYRTSDLRLAIEHVYGHAGVHGNEEADKLATFAASLTTIILENKDTSKLKIPYEFPSTWVLVTGFTIALVLLGFYVLRKRRS